MWKCLSLCLLVTGLMAGGLGCDSGNRPTNGSTDREPARVEVFRVESRQVASDAGNTIGGFPILSTGKEQGPDFAARLSKLLRSDGVTPNRKKCGLEPGVAYRIWNGNKAMEVLVCFKCDVLWAYEVGEKGEPLQRDWKDFDPVRPELLALTREAFPDDAEIQGLPERRQ